MSDTNIDAESNPYLRGPPTEFEPAESFSREAIEGQIALLREVVREHDHRYYVAADSLVSDAAYDALFSRLVALEDAFSLDTTNSPANRVSGEPIDALETVERVASMLSTGQSTDAGDLRKFGERVRHEAGAVDYACEPGFDSLPVRVIYGDGEFIRATTRSDGRHGDDVNAQVKTIPTVPLSSCGDHPNRLVVRSEIYMPKSDFGDLNARHVEADEDAFANPRNAAVRTLRNLDPSVVVDHPLAMFFYDVLDASTRPDSQWAALDCLHEWGLRVTDRIERAGDVAETVGCRDRVQAARDDLDYEIDGTVIKMDSRDIRERLGEKSHSVRWAFTYKFSAHHEVTTVRDVVVQARRTNRLTPVVILNPVDVGGVTVSRATFHNPDERVALGVTVGGRVCVKRTDDAIPQVVEVTEDGGGYYEFPDECPACGNAVDHGDPLAFCLDGLSCPAQREASIGHFAVKGVMDIGDLGEERVTRLVDTGLVETIADLYDLTAGDLAESEGRGETSAENLVTAVGDAKRPSLDSFPVGLSIPEMGEATTRGLAHEFGSTKAFPIEAGTEEDEFDAFEERLTTVPDVGETVVCRVRDFFENAGSRAMVRALLDHGVDPEPVESDGDELDGLMFVATGTLAASRSDVTKLIESHSGNVTGSVSGNTDYLIVGENPGRSKRNDAEASDVPTFTETEFEVLLAERGVAYPPK